jgi:myo-inositol-1(or 4)-monophosphatase
MPVDGWLDVCRAAVEDVRAALRDLPGRAQREPVVGLGLGGDETTAVDEAAERAVVARLRSTGEPFVLVSEELGEEAVNGGGDLRIVLDPIDGSLNAKRGLPLFALSVAFAEGDRMGDVRLGYVFDFGTGEEWTAARGGGAFLDGVRLGDERPKDEIEILAFEATTTAFVAERAAAVAPLAYRLRIFGSLALSLCHLAAGRVDAVCSLKAARSVDIAAAQLLVREVGLAIELFEDGAFDDAALDLGARSRVVAAPTSDACARLAEALSSHPAP